tara:strand:+ start:22 stop:369 length:348 start_codon:yes stop_codon:yes gene_type:complete
MGWEDIIKIRELHNFKQAQKYLEGVQKDIDTMIYLLKEENGGWRKNRNKLMVLLDTSYIDPDFEGEVNMLMELVEEVRDKAKELDEMPEMDSFAFALENERGETESGYNDPRFEG